MRLQVGSYPIPLSVLTCLSGWNAPRKSLLLVHPDGEGSKATNEDLNISFAPTPDYAGIARAASGNKIWAGCAYSAEELPKLLEEAVQSVKNGTGAVLEVRLDGAYGVKESEKGGEAAGKGVEESNGAPVEGVKMENKGEAGVEMVTANGTA